MSFYYCTQKQLKLQTLVFSSEANEDPDSLIPDDLIPDVIPDEKKPLDPSEDESEEEEDWGGDEDDDYDDEEDYHLQNSA